MSDQTYIIPDNPTYNPNIRRLQNSDPGNAELVLNPIFQQIINNLAALFVGNVNTHIAFQEIMNTFNFAVTAANTAAKNANDNANDRVPLSNIGSATGGTLPVARGGTGVNTLDQHAQQLFNRRYFGAGGAARLPCYSDETMGVPGHTTADDLRRGMGAVHNNFLQRETVSGTFNGGSWDIDRSGNDVSLHIVINSSAGIDVVAHTLFNIPDEYRPIRNHHVRWTVNATATSLGFVQIQNNGNVTIHGTVTRVSAVVNRHFEHTYVCSREGG